MRTLDDQPLWDQLTLFGPIPTRPEHTQSVQLDLHDAEKNVVPIEASAVLRRMRIIAPF